MTIRAWKRGEDALLREFLYEAIFVPEGVDPPERSILDQPELAVYCEGFGGGRADNCLVAEADGRPVGAVWSRIMHDYGHVDDETPSLAISLYPGYRGLGIGTALMREMLGLLKAAGCRQVSLSVQKANYAARMYRKLGFETVRETEEEYIMLYRFAPASSPE
jgi:ribosomal protein S18 acetylase RimI-like enzyme